MTRGRSAWRFAFIFSASLLFAGALAADWLLWLDGPSGRSNPHDPKSPLFAPTAAPPPFNPTRTATPTHSPTPSDSPTRPPTATPTWSCTPSFTESPSITSTLTPSSSATESPSATLTWSATASPSMTPTTTPTQAPIRFEDFDSGVPPGQGDYGDTGYSLTQSLDSTEYVSAPNSLRIDVNTAAGWYAGFFFNSNYYNASGVVDASGMLSLVFRIKTDKDLYFSARFNEGTAAEAGGDEENWESRRVFVPPGTAWQTVRLNLGQFKEDPWNPECNPSFLPPNASPCNTMGDNLMGLQSLKTFEIEFEPIAGTAQIFLDDIGFDPQSSVHNGNWPAVSNFDLDAMTVLHSGSLGFYTDKEGNPCPASSSQASISHAASGGWDGGAYARLTGTVDASPDCGFAYWDYWIYLDGDQDLSAYTGLRLRRRHGPGLVNATVYLGTNTDPCVGGWNSSYAMMACNPAWSTANLAFSSFTDSGACPYVGSGNLSNVSYILIVTYDPAASALDLDDLEFY